jgi:hypothetical protein
MPLKKTIETPVKAAPGRVVLRMLGDAGHLTRLL